MNRGLGVDGLTYLHGHGDICGFMEHLFDGAIVTLAELLVELELAHVDGKAGAI